MTPPDLVEVQSPWGGYQLAIPANDHIANSIAATSRPYEHELLAAVVALTAPGDHILDVGANIGNHTTYWGLSGRRVTAFEPNEATRGYLERNIALNHLEALVHVKGVALGRRNGRGSLQNLIDGNMGAVAVQQQEDGKVEIIPLDDLRLEECALIKIDVEGSEAEVVTGSIATIQRCSPYIIAEARSGSDETYATLRALGYWRIPANLASTDTFLYAPPGRRLRPFFVGRLWVLASKYAMRRILRRSFRALPSGLQEKIRRRY
ncbi:FkbM family methyltransferase [Blastococcus sp. SYSU DS0973]